MKIDFVKHKTWFLSLSLIFVTLSLVSIAVFKLKPGIDFKSGSLWQVRIDNTSEENIKNFFRSDLQIPDALVSYDSQNNSYAIALKEISEAQHIEFRDKMSVKFQKLTDLDFGTTSPSISSELKDKAFWLVIFGLIVVASYVAFSFRKISHPVTSFSYGMATLIALFHDVTIAAGFYALMGHYRGVTVDTNFIIALLTIASFSAQDTIVVFDRIRENLLEAKGKFNFSEIVNRSVNEVFKRSVNTSVSIMIVLAAIAFLGPISVKYFALTMLLGMFFGTYSSIFVASLLLVLKYQLDIKTKKL